MNERDLLKQQSFDRLERAEIAVLKLEVKITDWQPCGCCRIGKIPRRPSTTASNFLWYTAKWHRAYCKVPGYELHLPEKHVTATMAEAIPEFWEFLHASFLNARAARDACKHPALVESEAEHKAAIERLRRHAQWAQLPTTDLRKITLYKTGEW